MRRLARTESYHTPHTYFGERARIKRSPTFTVLFFFFFCVGKGGGGDMIVTRSENYVPGLVFSQKHHNLYRTVRGRTLGYELVFLFYLFCFISFFFPIFLDGAKRRLDTSAESTRWSEHCIAQGKRKHRRVPPFTRGCFDGVARTDRQLRPLVRESVFELEVGA